MSNGIFLLLRDYVMLCYVRMSNFMFMMSEYRIKICKGVFHKLIDINTMGSYKIVYSEIIWVMNSMKYKKEEISIHAIVNSHFKFVFAIDNFVVHTSR